jgi:hypothetical protein
MRKKGASSYIKQRVQLLKNIRRLSVHKLNRFLKFAQESFPRLLGLIVQRFLLHTQRPIIQSYQLENNGKYREFNSNSNKNYEPP